MKLMNIRNTLTEMAKILEMTRKIVKSVMIMIILFNVYELCDC